MRQIIFTAILIFAAANLYSQAETKNPAIIKQRNLLREYALCKCLNYGFPNDSLLKKDFSVTVLVEQLDYSPQVYLGIDSVIKKITDSIPISKYIDENGKRGIMINCIDYYNSKEFKMYINKLDKYLRIK